MWNKVSCIRKQHNTKNSLQTVDLLIETVTHKTNTDSSTNMYNHQTDKLHTNQVSYVRYLILSFIAFSSASRYFLTCSCTLTMARDIVSCPSNTACLPESEDKNLLLHNSKRSNCINYMEFPSLKSLSLNTNVIVHSLFPISIQELETLFWFQPFQYNQAINIDM